MSYRLMTKVDSTYNYGAVAIVPYSGPHETYEEALRELEKAKREAPSYEVWIEDVPALTRVTPRGKRGV